MTLCVLFGLLLIVTALVSYAIAILYPGLEAIDERAGFDVEDRRKSLSALAVGAALLVLALGLA